MNDYTPDQPPDWEPNPTHDRVITISPGTASAFLFGCALSLFCSGGLAVWARSSENYRIECLGLAVFFYLVGMYGIWELVSLAAGWHKRKHSRHHDPQN